MRDWGCHVIAGNCEEQLAEASDSCACGFEEGTECDTLAKGWYPFANARMSAESRAWMAKLPKTITFGIGGLTLRVIHGGVGVINRFVFASQRDVLAEVADVKPRFYFLALTFFCGTGGSSEPKPIPENREDSGMEVLTPE